MVLVSMNNSQINVYNETEFSSWIKNISTDFSEKNFCNLIEEHSLEMENRKNISKNKYLESLPHGFRWETTKRINTNINGIKKVVMSIDTSEKMRTKAYKFMNGFINCISKIGGNAYVDKVEADDNTKFTLLGSEYKCNLYEKQTKLRNRAKIENKKMSPLYEAEYTGNLYFEVLSEDKNDKLQLLQELEINNSDMIKSKLAELLLKLRDDAICKKKIIDYEASKREELIEKQYRKHIEEKQHEEQVRIKKAELEERQKIQEKIKLHIDKWEDTNRALIYINDLRLISGLSEHNRVLLLNYCDYVEEIYNKSEFYKEILEFSQELEI